jgi:2-methylcitrate dehydratase PrpD
MTKAPPPSALAVFASFASSASGASCQEQLSLHLADGLIALLAGRNSLEGRALTDFFTRTETPALAALSANAACMRLSEVDDIHRPSAVTASAIALPVALAMHDLAASTGASTQRFFDAIFVGHALSIQLALAMGGARLLVRGLWPSYLVAPFGAAATAGRMLGLSPERMTHALAIALAQTPRAVGKSSGSRPARWLLFANGVKAGYLAALAAADGVDGDVGLLDAAWLQTVGGDLSDARLLVPEPHTHELSIKPHCAAKQTLSAVHGLMTLITQGLAPASIESMTVSVPPVYAQMIDREPASASRLASMVSVRWQLALAALRPELLDDVSRHIFPGDKALLDFADKVHVEACANLDDEYPSIWPARLSVIASGRSHDILVKNSAGDPNTNFGIDGVKNKAKRMLKQHAEITLVSLGLKAASSADSLEQVCRYCQKTQLDPYS